MKHYFFQKKSNPKKILKKSFPRFFHLVFHRKKTAQKITTQPQKIRKPLADYSGLAITDFVIEMPFLRLPVKTAIRLMPERMSGASLKTTGLKSHCGASFGPKIPKNPEKMPKYPKTQVELNQTEISLNTILEQCFPNFKKFSDF